MAKQLWNDNDIFAKRTVKSYASYQNAVNAAEKIIGDQPIRYIIAATPEDRFFPVALGQDALDAGLHFHMCVTN